MCGRWSSHSLVVYLMVLCKIQALLLPSRRVVLGGGRLAVLALRGAGRRTYSRSRQIGITKARGNVKKLREKRSQTAAAVGGQCRRRRGWWRTRRREVKVKPTFRPHFSPEWRRIKADEAWFSTWEPIYVLREGRHVAPKWGHHLGQSRRSVRVPTTSPTRFDPVPEGLVSMPRCTKAGKSCCVIRAVVTCLLLFGALLAKGMRAVSIFICS